MSRFSSPLQCRKTDRTTGLASAIANAGHLCEFNKGVKLIIEGSEDGIY